MCVKVGDALTPQKLLLANVAHAAGLKKRLEVLRQQDSPDNRAERRTITQVADDLQRLHREASAFVRKAAAPGS